jgi:hypothetical protein
MTTDRADPNEDPFDQAVGDVADAIELARSYFRDVRVLNPVLADLIALAGLILTREAELDRRTRNDFAEKVNNRLDGLCGALDQVGAAVRKDADEVREIFGRKREPDPGPKTH